MNTTFSGGFPGMYERPCNDFTRGYDDHVFTEIKSRHGYYAMCECGLKKRTSCQCAECGLTHQKASDATPEQRMEHELIRLHTKLDSYRSINSIGAEASSVENGDKLNG